MNQPGSSRWEKKNSELMKQAGSWRWKKEIGQPDWLAQGPPQSRARWQNAAWHLWTSLAEPPLLAEAKARHCAHVRKGSGPSGVGRQPQGDPLDREAGRSASDRPRWQEHNY